MGKKEKEGKEKMRKEEEGKDKEKEKGTEKGNCRHRGHAQSADRVERLPVFEGKPVNSLRRRREWDGAGCGRSLAFFCTLIVRS